MPAILTSTKTLKKNTVKVVYKNGISETVSRILWSGLYMARKEDIVTYEFIEETIEY